MSAGDRGADAWTNVTGDLCANEEWGYGGGKLMAVAPGTDEVIFGVSDKGLWSSADGGATWKKMGAGGGDRIINRPVEIVFDPKNPAVFWYCGIYGTGVYRTDDGGKTFKALGLWHIGGIAVDFTDPERKILLACMNERDHSLQISTDGGKTWKLIGDRLPPKTNFTTNPIIIDSKTFIINCSSWGRGLSFGIYRSEDAGETWTKVADYGPLGTPCIASDGSIIWSHLWSAGLIKSTDKGKTWKKLTPLIKVNPIEILPGKLLAWEGTRLYISGDGGETWKTLGPQAQFQIGNAFYSRKRNCFYATRTSPRRGDAVYRWDAPADLEKAAGIVSNVTIVWDGDGFDRGSAWSSKDTAPLKVVDNMAHNGKHSLHFRNEAEGPVTQGWNWFSWAEGYGTDITGQQKLFFWARVQESAPKALQVSLNCGPGKVNSRIVNVYDYCKDAADGNWHEVVIPLKDLLGADKFDPRMVYELRVMSENAAGGKFSLYVDEIGFLK